LQLQQRHQELFLGLFLFDGSAIIPKDRSLGPMAIRRGAEGPVSPESRRQRDSKSELAKGASIRRMVCLVRIRAANDDMRTI
jgi:hypothetical protein